MRDSFENVFNPAATAADMRTRERAGTMTFTGIPGADLQVDGRWSVAEEIVRCSPLSTDDETVSAHSTFETGLKVNVAGCSNEREVGCVLSPTEGSYMYRNIGLNGLSLKASEPIAQANYFNEPVTRR